MGIQILPQEGSFASNLGAGLGQGLAQQIPEEIKRYRLAKGLENLGQSGQQQTPYQMLSSLASIPGIDPGLISVLAPALQNQLARNEAIQGGIPQTQGRAPQTPQFEGRAREQREGFLQQPSGQEIETLARTLVQSQPNLYPTLDAARSQAERFLGQEFQADVSYQQRQDLLRKGFDEAIEAYLQEDKSLQRGEIGGRVEQKLLQELLDKGSESRTAPRTLAQQYAKRAFEIAKEKQSMRKVYSSWDKTNPPSEKEIDSLRSLKKKYIDYGIPLDDFIEDIQTTQNISPGAAAYITDPMTDTKAGKYLHSLKENRGIEGVKGVFTNQESQIADKLAPLIDNKDLLGSLAYIAQAKGYDGNKLLGELQKRLKPDQITQMQGRDLRERQIPRMRSLDEVWLMGFSGERKKARK